MDKVFFMKPFIENFNKKDVFTKTFAIILRVLAIISIVAAFVIWVLLWKVVFEIPSAGIAGGVIFQIFFLVGIYMASHAAFLRAQDISKLKTKEYIVVPAATVFLKLLGEIYASLTAAVALGGGILIWFAGGYGLQLLEEVPQFIPQYGGGTTFLGGLVFLIGGLAFAFFTLVAFYFASEFFKMVMDIALNTKKG
ncbi:MAG: hypothetical protein GF421_09705 [Candidatus Aminicenantes bacterium]|nr:hypothetical protein [Candidatus Aminicenantes bacterium]